MGRSPKKHDHDHDSTALVKGQRELPSYSKTIPAFRSEYTNEQGKSLRGLDFDSTMRFSGLAWLPGNLFNWDLLCLHDDLVDSTTFTFNGLQKVFWNWKSVNVVSHDYGVARELEAQLQEARPEERHNIVDTMRKMVYRQFALQVIRQLNIGPHVMEDHPVRQGLRGLSLYVVYVLLATMN